MAQDKTMMILGVAAVGLAAYYVFGTGSTGPRPPQGYGNAMPIPPGSTYPGGGGVQNQTGDYMWVTATGNLINSLGQAFGNIYGAVTANQSQADNGQPSAF